MHTHTDFEKVQVYVRSSITLVLYFFICYCCCCCNFFHSLPLSFSRFRYLLLSFLLVYVCFVVQFITICVFGHREQQYIIITTITKSKRTKKACSDHHSNIYIQQYRISLPHAYLELPIYFFFFVSPLYSSTLSLNS